MNGYLNGTSLVEEDFEEDDFVDEGFAEDFVDDEGMEDVLEALEDLDDDEAAEFLGPLIGAAAPGLIGGLGSLFGGSRRRSRPPQLRAIPRRASRLPSVPGLSQRSFLASLRGFATKNELRRTAATLDRKITVVDRRNAALGRQVQGINNRVNTTQRRLSQEVNRLRRADANQQRGISALRRRDSQLAQEVNNVRQTSLAVSLLGGGEKDYEVTDIRQNTVLVPDVNPTTGVPTGTFTPQQQLSEIKLKPKGDSFDDLLPLVLLGGLGGTGTSRGGLDPLLLILLLRR
jgi:hypothetical protein